jgi:hypothetical protein
LAIGSKKLFLVVHEYVDLAEDTVGDGAGAGDVVASVTVDDDDDFIWRQNDANSDIAKRITGSEIAVLNECLLEQK